MLNFSCYRIAVGDGGLKSTSTSVKNVSPNSSTIRALVAIGEKGVAATWWLRRLAWTGESFNILPPWTGDRSFYLASFYFDADLIRTSDPIDN